MLAEAPEYSSVSPPELQTNMLLDNLSKIERKFFLLLLFYIYLFLCYLNYFLRKQECFELLLSTIFIYSYFRDDFISIIECIHTLVHHYYYKKIFNWQCFERSAGNIVLAA